MFYGYNNYKKGVLVGYPTCQINKYETVVTTIKKFHNPNEKLAIWGWNTDIYVQCQAQQATQMNHNPFEIPLYNISKDMLEKHRTRYINDLEKSQPVVFIDTNEQFGKPNATKVYGLEIFSNLRKIIHLNYIYYGLVDDMKIYIHKKRFKEKTKLSVLIPAYNEENR